MAQNIVEYKANILPSGKTGEVMTPYKEAPPMTPINIADAETAAKVKFGGAVTDIGESMIKVEQYRQNVVAENFINSFINNQITQQREWETNNQGVKATPERLIERQEALRQSVEDTIAAAEVDPITRNAMKKALDHQVNQKFLESSNHLQAQVRVVAVENVNADLAFRKSNVKQGMDIEKQIEQHALTFRNNLPNHPALFLAHADEIRAVGAEATKDAKETAIILELNETHKSNVDEMLKEVESFEFLKKHGKKIQQEIRSDILARAVIQERQYKQFAEQKVGAAATKIYQSSGMAKITPEDIAGLRPSEVADIEKIKDYQVRQNRAEYRLGKQIAAQDRIEKSNAISGTIMAKILNGEEIDNLNIYKEVPKGLDINEANRLVLMNGKIAGDPKYKDGITILKEARRNGVLKNEEYTTILNKFQKQVDEAGANANASKIANDLITPKKPGIVKEWLDNIYFNSVEAAKKREMKSVGLPVYLQSDLEYTAKKNNITVEEVKRRLGVK